MTEVVISPNEVSLNAVRYPIKGRVKRSLISRFPTKQITGDYSYDNEQYLSNYIVSDLRGGIGLEEYDDVVANKCWWSNCILSYKGHITLPRLATAITLPSYDATITNAGFETGDPPSSWTLVDGGDGGNYAVSQNGVEHQAGSYSIQFLELNGTGTAYIYQDLTWNTKYRNSTITFAAYLKGHASFSLQLKVGIDDGVGTTYSATTNANEWTAKSVSRRMDAAATRIRLIIHVQNLQGAGTDGYGWADTCTITYRATTSPIKFCNFNSNFYLGSGATLFKMSTDGTAYTTLYDFAASITDIRSGVGASMFICTGDSTNYYYMNTSEAFTQADAAYTKTMMWDGKQFFIKNTGEFWYAVNANNATPTWVDADTGGNLTGLPAGSVESLFIGIDAGGEDIIYAATHDVLKAYDFANLKWIDTTVRLPNHPNGGCGATTWQDGIYIPVGLGVLRYVPGNVEVPSIGLDRNGGLPAEYNGEIIASCPDGINELFVLVGADQVTGTQKSGLYAYDGDGWQCWWASSTNDGAMHDAVVSSAYGYRVWFDHADSIYYIDIPRGITNPKKLTTFTYGASGSLLTPWFDAGSSVFDKLAKRIIVYTKGTSANETVVVKYRTDRTNTDLATGWTTLGTIIAAGATTYTFGTSAVGVSFSAIQFAFDLVRGSTNTNTPDIQAVTFSYLKLLDQKWGWTFNIDCTGDYKGNTAQQIEAALVTAAETDTLVEFTYRDDSTGAHTYYVKVTDFDQESESGNSSRGTFKVSVIQP